MTNPVPTLEQLQVLRLTQTNIKIAEDYGVSLSTVKRWGRHLGVKSRPVRDRSVMDPFKAAAIEMDALLPTNRATAPAPVVDEGVTLMQRCKQVLGRRMHEDHRGYLLDGRPVNSHQVIKAAQSVRDAQLLKSAGLVKS